MGGHTILVVEDNPITRKMIRVTVELEGHTVLEAPDGRTALDLMAQRRPDLVLQDLILPDIDGVELVKRLRELPGGREVPIVCVSGFLPRIEELRVSGGGFDDILVKPVEPSALLRCVQELLPRPAPAPEGPGAGRRVLVVDDDAVQRKLLTLRLGSLGFRVETAGDGAEALERARAAPPDAIVSDVFMPRLDGFALCLAVRGDPRLAGIPVVLLSSVYVEEADRALRLEVGANAWVDRRPDYQEAIAALLRCLAGVAPAPRAASAEAARAQYTQRLVRQLEHQASVNVNLAQRAALQAAELSVLGGISDAMARTPDVEPALEEILYRCLDAGGLSRGVLYLAGPDGRLFLRAQMGYDDLPPGELEGFFGHIDLLDRIVGEGDVVAIPSGAVPEPTAQDLLARSRGTFALVAPLVSHGTRLGAILMGSRAQKLTEEDWLLFARAVAVQVGQAVALGRAFAQVAASERRHRTLFENARDAMLLSDDANRVVDANPAARALTGRSLEELRSMRIGEIVYPPVGAAVEGESVPADHTLLLKDGTRRLVEVSASPVAPDLRLSVLHDVTAQRRVEEAEWARQVADAASRAKSEFLSRMSHELRTPLNAILGFAQLLQMEIETPEQRESVQHILRGGRHLLDLINEVLDITRIETGRLHLSPEPVAVADLLRECLDLIQPLAAQRDIRLHLEALAEERHVQADRQRLKQVLLNLLANAVKYNREGGAVTAACEAAPGDRLRLRVSDTGPGIPPALLEHLFMPFDRLGAEQSGVEGTGLGLALTKRLVEAMGGAVGVESALGQGSTFWVELPLAEAPAERAGGTPAEALAPAAAPGPAVTVLYIEDNLSNLRLIERVLAHRPQVRLLPAMQGRLGLDLAREHRPALILLDLHLPDVPGHEVLRHLQGDDRTRDIPVIVISAEATPGQVERLKATGARAYLTKPLNVQELLAVLDETLSRRAGVPSGGTPGGGG